jgi:hypothetical protein
VQVHSCLHRSFGRTGLCDTFEPGCDIDTISEYVIAFDEDVPEVDPDRIQHMPILWVTFVAFGYYRLHRHCAFDRIDHRGKLKHGADLIEAHQP